MADKNGALDWNDIIDTDDDSGSYIELTEGDYTFTVKSVDRGRFPGSTKIPPCFKAVINLDIDSDRGVAHGKFDLILHTALKWKIAQFFRCIGMKKHGEQLTMDWDAVPGKRGRAHFKPRPYTDRNGAIRRANELEAFYDYDEQFMTTTPIAGGSRWADAEV